MKASADHFPPNVFAPDGFQPDSGGRALIGPQRYIQGPGAFGKMGHYLSLIRPKRVGVLITDRGQREHGETLFGSLKAHGIEHAVSLFNGECSVEEITAQSEHFEGLEIDCLIAAGGGKCLDTGKGIAFRLEIPLVIAPTLASTDAPCSAVSVIYSPDGIFTGAEFYPSSPAMVVVDTEIIAAAPVRFLVAGIGDGLSTWYEAEACWRNPRGASVLGPRPTRAALSLARTCADILFEEGVAAVKAAEDHQVNVALEDVIEANTLLSGIGFESGGLAGAHAVAQAYTALPFVEKTFLHGEMVAMGVLAQLAMEQNSEEATRVAEFFALVGLPIHLGQLGIDAADEQVLDPVVAGALAFPYLSNLPVPQDEASVRKALREAHAIGLSVEERLGNAAYRKLHPGGS